MNKVNYLFIIALALLLFGCSKQQPQFGKEPLHLDNFGLDIDVETFFKDESLFRNNDKYTLKADEETIKIDDTDSTLRYVRYSVTSSPSGDTLARYNDFYFGDMDVVMDFDDKETFMVAAAQENVRPGQIDSLVRDISTEYGNFITTDNTDKPRYITYEWKKGDKLAKLVLDVDNPLYFNNKDSEQKPDTNKLFTEAYHKAESITVNFFITKPKFDHYIKKASSTSGLLTRYNN